MKTAMQLASESDFVRIKDKDSAMSCLWMITGWESTPGNESIRAVQVRAPHMKLKFKEEDLKGAEFLKLETVGVA